jgi:hypothetical protein
MTFDVNVSKEESDVISDRLSVEGAAIVAEISVNGSSEDSSTSVAEVVIDVASVDEIDDAITKETRVSDKDEDVDVDAGEGNPIEDGEALLHVPNPL